MDTKRDFHTPQWLGTEIVGATQCTNTGLQNITRPADTKDARKNFDYLEVGTGARKIRLYSSADAIFIKAAAVLSQLKVQPRAAAVYSRYVVDKAKKSNWTHDSKTANVWLVLDGLEFSQEEYGEAQIPLPLEFLTDSEVLDWVEDGAVLLNVSKITLDVLNRLEDMREARLRDRGQSRDQMSPEQAARMVRKMGKNKAAG
jgi:hypothetical protein